jgi:hypothetical protein
VAIFIYCILGSKIPTKCHTPQQKRSPLASTIQNNHRSSRLHPAKRIKQTDFEKELQGMLTVKVFFRIET